MVLQDPKSGRDFTFELKDRLIRDAELDGWKEIPVTPVTDVEENGETTEVSDGDENSASKATIKTLLPGTRKHQTTFSEGAHYVQFEMTNNRSRLHERCTSPVQHRFWG
jgi:hypothetical protein